MQTHHQTTVTVVLDTQCCTVASLVLLTVILFFAGFPQILTMTYSNVSMEWQYGQFLNLYWCNSWLIPTPWTLQHKEADSSGMFQLVPFQNDGAKAEKGDKNTSRSLLEQNGIHYSPLQVIKGMDLKVRP